MINKTSHPIKVKVEKNISTKTNLCLSSRKCIKGARKSA